MNRFAKPLLGLLIVVSSTGCNLIGSLINQKPNSQGHKVTINYTVPNFQYLNLNNQKFEDVPKALLNVSLVTESLGGGALTPVTTNGAQSQTVIQVPSSGSYTFRLNLLGTTGVIEGVGAQFATIIEDTTLSIPLRASLAKLEINSAPKELTSGTSGEIDVSAYGLEFRIDPKEYVLSATALGAGTVSVTEQADKSQKITATANTVTASEDLNVVITATGPSSAGNINTVTANAKITLKP